MITGWNKKTRIPAVARSTARLSQVAAPGRAATRTRFAAVECQKQDFPDLGIMRIEAVP